MSGWSSGEMSQEPDEWQQFMDVRAANLRRAAELSAKLGARPEGFPVDVQVYGPELNNSTHRPLAGQGLFVYGKRFPGGRILGDIYRFIVITPEGELMVFEGRTRHISAGGYPDARWQPENWSTVDRYRPEGINPYAYRDQISIPDYINDEMHVGEALEAAASRYM